jgi:methylated-DNA-[protein]-cysteine S-methyltransferase
VGASDGACYCFGMTSQTFAIFDTAIGACGIVWTDRGICSVQLPEGSEAATRVRVLRRHAGAVEGVPPTDVQSAIDGIVALLAGERADLNEIKIDHETTPAFNAKVYAIARTIPPGETLTYGDIAKRLGDPLLARDVGTALGQNPTPLIVPCHRVLAAGGKTGGFSATGGVVTKLQLLSIEKAQPGGPTLFEHLPLAVRR